MTMPDDVVRTDPEPVRAIHDPRAIQILSARFAGVQTRQEVLFPTPGEATR
jgi:hypothetical protein